MCGSDSLEESCGKKKHNSEEKSKEESFKGHQKCSAGTMDGARSNAHGSITHPFAAQTGKQCGLAMKKLVEKGMETVHEEPPCPQKKREGMDMKKLWLCEKLK